MMFSKFTGTTEICVVTTSNRQVEEYFKLKEDSSGAPAV